MKQLDFLDVFALIFGLVFIILNRRFAMFARQFYLKNFQINHGRAIFRGAFVLFGCFLVALTIIRIFELKL